MVHKTARVPQASWAFPSFTFFPFGAAIALVTAADTSHKACQILSQK